MIFLRYVGASGLSKYLFISENKQFRFDTWNHSFFRLLQAALQAPVTELIAEKQNGLPKSVSAMMLPRAVALAKATALPLPASPAQGNPGEAPARSSGNAMVSESHMVCACFHNTSGCQTKAGTTVFPASVSLQRCVYCTTSRKCNRLNRA